MAQEPSSKELLEAVKQQESRGRRYDSSGKLLEGPMTKYGTAKGEMQVLDSTMRKPGYGVKPAKDDSPDERARVGQELLDVFVKKYKDRDTALIAYNWGPGNTNKWLAAGADPAKLPKETRDYVSRISGMLSGTKVAEASTTKKPVDKSPAAAAAAPVAESTTSKLPEAVAPVLASLGKSYQTALAASVLAAQTSKEDEDDDLTQAERFAQYMEENQPAAEMPMMKTSLASLTEEPRPAVLGFTEPALPKKRARPQLVKMFADGGEASAPDIGDTPAREALANLFANRETIPGAGESTTAGASKNFDVLGGNLNIGAALTSLNREEKQELAKNLMASYTRNIGDATVGLNINRPMDIPEDVYQASLMGSMPIGEGRAMLSAQGTRVNGQNYPVNQMIGYERQVGPGQLSISASQMKDFPQSRQYQLQYRMPLGRADGGPVYRADGSPEGGEQLTPQQIEQIAQRQQDARAYNQQMLEAPTRLDTYTGLAKGFTQNLVPNIVGIPVDLTTMALRPFGYRNEKPVLGSEWNKEFLSEYGMRPEPPPEGTNERNWYDVGNFGTFFVNPASATRSAVTTGGKLLEKGKEVAQTTKAGIELGVESTKKNAQTAKKMLDALKKPKEAPRTTRTEPTMAPEPLPERPPAPAPAPAPIPVVTEAPVAPPLAAEPLAPPPAEVAVPQEMLPPPPAMTQLPVSTPVAPPMQAGVPADRPFVGRLDAFVDTIKNPVQLGQLKGQLKGKFRDYDIERVERAFAGMDDKTKLTPDQIKQALAGTHSPTKWISETLPPEKHKYHQTMDNVWDKELGTTNLYLEQPEQILLATKLFDEGGTSLGAFVANSTLAIDAKKLEDARKLLSNPDLTKVVDPELAARVSSKLDKAEGNIKLIDQFERDIKNIERGFTRPVLFEHNGENVWFKFKDDFVKQKQEALNQQLMAQGMSKYEAILESGRQLFSDTTYPALNREAEAFASMRVQELAREQARSHSINIPDMPINWSDPATKTMDPIGHLTDAQAELKNALEPSVQTVHEATKNVQRFMNDDVKQLGLVLQNAAAYRGKHKHVAAGPYPIGFTRFSEHEATIPGMGTVQGRHFHELQSDLSKDMRKSGTVGGSAAKDTKELNSLRDQMEQHRNQAMDQLQAVQKELNNGSLDIPAANEKSQKIRNALENKINPIEHRIQVLHSRTRDGASYSLQEPFAGFENNQMVRQQLLMKNAIHAAMKDGKSFATFPGNESSKPQLYVGKVLPNLKQVIKDLGGEKAGFELRQIELPPDKHGNPITATGVVWSPEAAARIVEKGVPFAKGGSVERLSADNRRYL